MGYIIQKYNPGHLKISHTPFQKKTHECILLVVWIPGFPLPFVLTIFQEYMPYLWVAFKNIQSYVLWV